ncbi:MAG: type 4a pilus biogenesis protein PilO [Gemmatimonadaceae bacterium]
MGLMPETQRDKLMAILCVMFLGGVYAYYEYLHKPKNTQLETLQARVEKLEEANGVIREEVARGTEKKLRAEADMYGRLLGVMRQLVPVGNELPTLLDQISTAARQVGLEIGEVTPLTVISGEVFDTHRYRMGVTGTYHRIAQFLSNVGALTRIVAPMNVSLAHSARTSGARPNEQLLDATFEVQTFVVKRSLSSSTPAAGTGQ